jgi:hypothetical protein
MVDASTCIPSASLRLVAATSRVTQDTLALIAFQAHFSGKKICPIFVVVVAAFVVPNIIIESGLLCRLRFDG